MIKKLRKYGVDAEKLVEIYRQCWLIRNFEEKVEELFQKGKVYGTMHLCVGQELTAAGACSLLRPEDKIISTHRGHGHCIAKGGDINLMMAELLARATGYCKGKGGSMHIADLDKGNLGANGIVAAGIPLAVGAALTSKMKNLGYVVLCFFGDGASNEGAFHEGLNLASIWKLPVVFFCENNLYAMSGSIKEMINIDRISKRAAAYGIPGVTIDGNDVYQVISETAEAIERARKGEGPTLIEALTYRWKGHSRSDARKYRTREEEAEWKTNNDPIARLKGELLKHGILTEARADEIQAETKRAVEEAVAFAENSPFPSPDSLEQDVYA